MLLLLGRLGTVAAAAANVAEESVAEAVAMAVEASEFRGELCVRNWRRVKKMGICRRVQGKDKVVGNGWLVSGF